MNIPAERDDVFRTWATSLCTNDIDAYLSCFADDLRLEDIALESVVQDKAVLRGDVRAWFDAFHDEQLTLDGYLVGQDDEIGTKWTLSATVVGHFPRLTEHAVMGRRFTKHGLSVFTFAPDGRFRTEVSYWNLTTIIRQIT
ncbi:nuclear transport factor 2 family protein [Kitasatospora sp. NPDC056783]|uniref:nuclear transport factor 2 family protein n=1 Tax=Kitasatospora sp. NPDC056783 TaxID=3345943 RepID=UPI00369D434E